jgi:glyoxylate/hydroxypyruvate reductase A
VGINSDEYALKDQTTDMAECDIWFGTLPKHGNYLIGRARWLQLESTDTSSADGVGIEYLTHCAGLFSKQIAESILGSLLMIIRGLSPSLKAQDTSTWKRWEIRAGLDSLFNKKIMILGGGSIAKEFIKLLTPFECECVVFRRNSQAIQDFETITTISELDQRLKETDIVVNALPQTDSTRLFLSEQRLNCFSNEAILVSCGRGSTLDEGSLIKLLIQKRIAAAVLDVTQEEPILEASPLWNTPNLFLTQHSFGGHKNEVQSKCEFFAHNLKRYMEGKELRNRV